MTMTRSDNWAWLDEGDTYAVRNQLRAIGGRWDAGRKQWKVPTHKLAEAKMIVLVGPNKVEVEIKKDPTEIRILKCIENHRLPLTTKMIAKEIDEDFFSTKHALEYLLEEEIVLRKRRREHEWSLNPSKIWVEEVARLNLSGPRRKKIRKIKDTRPGFRDDPPSGPTTRDTIEIEVDPHRLCRLEDKIDAIGNWQVIADERDKELEEKVRKLEARPVNSGVVEIRINKPDGKVKKLKAVLPEVFPHILDLAQARRNILLVGPAGCGKSHVSKLVADSLGLRFGAVNCTSGMSETHLLGRGTPNITDGKTRFQTTDFLRCYEEGGVFLMDEIDGADPNLLLAFNTATSNDYCNVPNRATKPIAVRHEDFILIATANTYGRGANRMYAGRNQLDEATLDRFRIGTVEMSFDAGIESSFKLEDDGLAWTPPEDYQDNYVERYAKQFADLGYDLRSTLQYIRYKIEQAKTLRRLMSTRFIRDAIIMRQSADWTTQKILEVYFQGWSEDELRRIQY